MLRLALAHLLVVLVVGVLDVSGAAENDIEFPSLLTSLGNKMALADDFYDDDEAEAPATPCCFPQVWQGISAHISGHSATKGRGRGHHGKPKPRISRAAYRFYVDGKNQRLAGALLESRLKSKNISWIFAISANRTGDFYLFDRATQKCRHRVLRNVSWHRQCIPSNATMRGEFSLGPLGGLDVQAWSFGGRSRSAPGFEGGNRPKPHVVYGAEIVVVPKTCVPVMAEHHGFICRGKDQQPEVDIADTGLFDDDDSDYENYAQ